MAGDDKKPKGDEKPGPAAVETGEFEVKVLKAIVHGGIYHAPGSTVKLPRERITAFGDSVKEVK